MNWTKITNLNDVPKEKMLFWHPDRYWKAGKLSNDSEYGWVISLFETYRDAREFTHYMQITPP